MLKRHWTRLIAGGWLAGLLLAGAVGCDRKPTVEDDGEINRPNLVEKHQNADAPTVFFPEQLKTDDVVLNQFIAIGLDHCAKGNYDKFRQLFGVAYEPPGEAQFEKLWQGVKQVRIEGVYPNRNRQPPEYYIHAVILLRKPDRSNRTERQAVVWVFREGDEWRMGPAPSDIASRVLIASTQPGASLPGGGGTRPAGEAQINPSGASTLPEQ